MQAILKQKAALVALVAWCGVLMAVRVSYSGGTTNGYLVWNMVLAVVPVVSASVLRLIDARPGRRSAGGLALMAAAFVVWLAFLPNAPYLATDLTHLRPIGSIPLWFDVALFGSFAATGLLLGYAAVADVELVLTAHFGKLVGTGVAVGSLLLSGFGIYVGRFLRWNSWDVVTSPLSLAAQAAHEIAHPLSHSLTWEVSAIYGLGLAIGYVALRGVASAWSPLPGAIS